MKEGFDIAASTYDDDFTHSHIGRLQRSRVWQLLARVSDNGESLNILELNCGTGEDAIRLAKQQNSVTATDVSEGMLEAARKKDQASLVNFQRLDINEIENFNFEVKFDLVFSNFGGLNCVDPATMMMLNETLLKILKPHGKFIAVIMPRFCIWETFYFLAKGKPKDAFRRRKEFVIANVSGSDVKTWYYSPKQHESLMRKGLKVEKVKPIGLCVPPSYLEGFFSKRLGILHILQSMESRLAVFSWQAKLADHYYIQYSIK